MRALTLYARSRQAPASLAAVLIGAVAVAALARLGGGALDDPRLATLVLVMGMTAVSVGLGGQDLALDRTAAIGWMPRRAAHLLLCGAFVGGVLLAAQSLSGQPVSFSFVARNSAGLLGLVAVGAAWGGVAYAWLPPFAWLSVSLVAPSSTDTASQVLGWMLREPGAQAATWTAVVLAVVGTTVYVVGGPRR
ncbi:hypothetical protein [Streptomyces sp. NPDC094049]|uniref:hypothetical protein n=1 Tax=Streptomyces sp. NPDC094049 TaxID=3154987 RepID=UPI003319F7E7